MTISIIICTYNRARLLEKCLQSLLDQMVEEVEIIIVDNNSTDNTLQVANKFQHHINKLSYTLEPKIGLSHARNTGYEIANGEWVLYLDDDGIAFDDMVQRALYLCHLNQYDCIGGMYYGYFERDCPQWINKDFGTKTLFSTQLKPCPFDVPHGGIVIYRKSMLRKLDGFNSKLGMIGNKLNYGEEDELQYRLSKIGGTIGFDPYLKIYHLVKEEYITVRHFLKSRFISGKTKAKITNENFFLRLSIFSTSLLNMAILKIPKTIVKLIIDKKYYYQNAIIDTFSGPLFYLGKLVSLSSKN